MRWLMILLVLTILVVSLPSITMATTVGEANQDVVYVAGLEPFTAETNYMSLPGYLRYEEFKTDGVWMTRLEAVRIVKSQGADPTLSEEDMKVLIGH